MRIATFNTELARKGPGILLRDILKGSDPQITAVMDTIVFAQADVIALQGFDYDLHNTALAAFADALRQRGIEYTYHFAAPSNAGLQTDVDLDGDGKLGGPGDAQGYGRFFGQGGMAILSRYPINTKEVQDFSTLLWKDLPDNLFPTLQSGPFPSDEAFNAQRLSSHGHWVVPIEHPAMGRFHLLTFHASPPVFDGPEDRNGKRNHDEVAFWGKYLSGAFGAAPAARFVLASDANLDPDRGDGRSEAIQALLNHPTLQDPLAGTTTVEWAETGEMRVDYVLPSRDWTVLDAGITPENLTASRHRLVWVDLKIP
ncbi:MAG: endonuclease/exonuclease/phosphatase family protein [Sulfitobacter sp.]